MTPVADDPKLPGLARALDAQAMLPWLRARRDLHTPFLARALSHVRTVVLEHTPGQRCVIAYELFAGSEACGCLIGKLYRQDCGRDIFENLQNLWHAAQLEQAKLFFAMPQPLLYDPEIGMVLQQAPPGKALTLFTNCDALFAAIQCTAKNLAVLHSLSLPQLARKNLNDHLSNSCAAGRHALVKGLPALAPLVNACLKLMAEDVSLAEAPLCPLHGDLNLAQVFIAGECAYFSDCEGVCLSHAALDVGNFLVTLKIHFGEKGEILRHVFLETYLAHAPATRLLGLRTYQALAYFRHALMSFRLPSSTGGREHLEEALKMSLMLLERKD